MLILHEIRSNRWKIIAGSVVLFILAVTIIWQFPYVKSLLEKGILEGFPEWIAGQARSQQNFPVYLAANWFDKNLQQFLGIVTILLAMGAIAREIENHTLEFLLARPLSRRRLLGEKVLAHLLVILSIAIITTIVLGVTGTVLGYPLNYFRLITGNIIAFGQFFAVYSLTLLISLFLDDQVKSGLASLILILIIVLITSFVDFLKPLNIFAYSSVTPYYVLGVFPWKGVLITYLTGAVLMVLSFIRFETRDF